MVRKELLLRGSSVSFSVRSDEPETGCYIGVQIWPVFGYSCILILPCLWQGGGSEA